jgi:hypothetical protein
MQRDDKEFFEGFAFEIDASIVDVEPGDDAIIFDTNLSIIMALCVGIEEAHKQILKEVKEALRKGVRVSLEIRISTEGCSSLSLFSMGGDGEYGGQQEMDC